MREMQLAWFRTGLESLDVPQDHAFIAIIDRMSIKMEIKYILNGYNITTEAIANPDSWGKGSGPAGDGKYLKDAIKKYCKMPIKDYEFINGFKHKVFIHYAVGVKTLIPLNFVSFTQRQMIDTLVDLYGYVPYGQKYFETLLTKFLTDIGYPCGLSMTYGEHGFKP